VDAEGAKRLGNGILSKRRIGGQMTDDKVFLLEARKASKKRRKRFCRGRDKAMTNSVLLERDSWGEKSDRGKQAEVTV